MLVLDIVLIPSHACQEVNKVANELTNVRVDMGNKELVPNGAQGSEDPLYRECIRLVGQDGTPSYGVLCPM